jgi:Bacterial SH3 domain
MRQLKLIPSSNVLPLKIARALRQAKPDGEAKADNWLPGATEPPLPLTSQRLELIKAYLKDPLGSAEESTATRIPQPVVLAQPAPSAPDQSRAPTPLLTSLLTISSGIRMLAAALILVALLPNLTLAAIFWLGLLPSPWSTPARPRESPLTEASTAPKVSSLPEADSAIPSPVLSAPETFEATAGQEVTLPIALDGADGVPPGSLIVVSGLPLGSTLSSGRVDGETWKLQPNEIGDLHLLVPNSPGTEVQLVMKLVTPKGDTIADTMTILKVTPGPEANIPVYRVRTQPIQGQVLSEPSQPAPEHLEETAVDPEAAEQSDHAVPPPTRRPESTARTASTNVDGRWITPSASVNLRSGPTASAAVLGVIEKGAKVRVLGRKRGWVQVTNPATSQKGWIYAGNVEAVR